MTEEDEDKTYFLPAISVVIIGEDGNLFMLNEIVEKGVRLKGKRMGGCSVATKTKHQIYRSPFTKWSVERMGNVPL